MKIIVRISNLQYEWNFDNLVKACPGNAIRYDSEAYDIKQLMEKSRKIGVFF